MNDENQYILDKYLLCKYIRDEHQKRYNEEISLFKLNKSLYFLFGYWVIEAALANEGRIDNNMRLYKTNFAAGQYGPIDKDITNNTEPSMCSNANWDEEMKNFVDNVLNKIFPKSNFDLLNITRSHDCWKNNAGDDSGKLNDIPEDMIVLEFRRYLNHE